MFECGGLGDMVDGVCVPHTSMGWGGVVFVVVLAFIIFTLMGLPGSASKGKNE